MLDTETIRPDAGVGFYLPLGPTLAASDEIINRMATVMRRQARNGRETTIENFRAAPETRGLTNAQLAAHRERAADIADETVIRQVDPDWRQPGAGPVDAGDVHGFPEAPLEPHPDDLLVSALPIATQILTGAAIVDVLHPAGFSPAQIRAIWPSLTVAMAEHIRALDKPSLVEIAMRFREHA